MIGAASQQVGDTLQDKRIVVNDNDRPFIP